jgi:hypothetical protein
LLPLSVVDYIEQNGLYLEDGIGLAAGSSSLDKGKGNEKESPGATGSASKAGAWFFGTFLDYGIQMPTISQDAHVLYRKTIIEFVWGDPFRRYNAVRTPLTFKTVMGWFVSQRK